MAKNNGGGGGSVLGFIGGIFSTVGNIVGSVVGAIDAKSQRKHEKDIMTYEATKYKTFYQFEGTNTNLYVLLFIAIVVMFLLWQISNIKSTKTLKN